MNINFDKFVFTAAVAVLCLVVGQTALAQNAMHLESDACSEEFSNVITARAEMEAMREIEIAQTYILKPDSVLEYSCFHGRVTELGDSNIFSDAVAHEALFPFPVGTFTPSGPFPQFLPTMTEDQVTAPNLNGSQPLRPGPHPPPAALTSSGLDNMLGTLVLRSIMDYWFESFAHVYAGGFYAATSVGSACNPMQLVWDFLKCKDFNKADFRTFLEFYYVDPRVVPSFPELNCNDPQRTARWADNITQVNAMGPGTQGGPDSVVTHVNQMDPGQCSSFAPIETGVSVYRGAPPELQSFNDAVCVAPGCYYDGAGCVQ